MWGHPGKARNMASSRRYIILHIIRSKFNYNTSLEIIQEGIAKVDQPDAGNS
jgi:hypothetical protein